MEPNPFRDIPAYSADQYPCLYPGCFAVFGRLYDLRRHVKTHFSLAMLWECEEGHPCGRYGPPRPYEQKGGFTRKDHYVRHRRDVHMVHKTDTEILAFARVKKVEKNLDVPIRFQCPPWMSTNNLARVLQSQDELKEKALEVGKNIVDDECSDSLGPESSDSDPLTSLSYASSDFSKASTISSLSNYSDEELPTVKHELILIFANDWRLQSLYSSALRNPSIGPIRFEKNFRRLLKRYAQNLSNEAQGALQKNAALMVRLHANDITIAIRRQFDPEAAGDSRRVEWLKKHSSEPGNLTMLDYNLSESAARNQDSRKMRSSNVAKDRFDAHCLPKESACDTDMISDQSSDSFNSEDDLSSSLPSLTEVKQFMILSFAFHGLRQQLDRFVHGAHEVSSSLSLSTVVFAADNNRVVKFTPWRLTGSPGLIDRIKGQLEKWIPNPIIWWPLQPPKVGCPNRYTRISWSCACAVELSIDIPNKMANQYWKSCSPVAPTSTTQPILPLHNTVPTASSSGTSTQTPSTTMSPGQNFQRFSRQTVSNLNHGSAVAQNSLPTVQYIHWCVDASKYETELNHISVSALDDVKLVSELKSAYNATRGFRRWVSLTACYGVRFVAFERINRSKDLVACGKEDLPCPRTNEEYVYSYRDPREQFIKTLEKSLIHSFHNPGGCGAQDIEDIIKRIPKKINGRLEKDYGVAGYGMHALPGWAVWKLMVALFLSQLGPLIFLIRWLQGHPGDLQNAFSLSMYFLAFLNIAVIIPDVWSLQK